jgi:predicted ATPase
MGLIYSRAMANYFINQPNYYPETLYPLVTASIGGVKTIRTLRSDAPFTDSDMKSSYLARRGNLATGERLLRACLDGLRQTQYGLLYTPFLSGLAEVLAPAGRPDDSLAAADEALRRTERRDGFCWMPEALRVKGEAPLLSDKADTTAAEDHFRRSLDLARRQGALSWELRTATSLGRLRRDENRIGGAYDLLSSVYDRFSEGFGTANLKAVK